MNYTKGEWKVDYGGTIGHIKAVSISGTPTVCRYAPPPDCASSITGEEIEANAHLIAAAPELYEALKFVTKTFEAYCPEAKIHSDAIKAARYALAKAEGK